VASKKNQYSGAEARLKAYEAKRQARELVEKKRSADNRFAIIVAAISVLIALGATYGHALLPGGTLAAAASPSPTASASSSALPSASASASSSVTPSASASPSTAPTNGPLVPSPALAERRTWSGTMQINGADLGISLSGKKAPQAVANFVTLAKKGFYQNVTCHRLTTAGIFVLQCGDPQGTGAGGPGYSWGPIENAPVSNIYKSGVLAMARRMDNGSTMGSQFFIVYKDSNIPADLAGGYTVFGRVTSGLDVVQGIAAKGSDNSNGQGDGKPKVATTIGAIKLN
jgi:peptidyl-prolyl cis-trans isomerase B (cyclophilin B)